MSRPSRRKAGIFSHNAGEAPCLVIGYGAIRQVISLSWAFDSRQSCTAAACRLLGHADQRIRTAYLLLRVTRACG